MFLTNLKARKVIKQKLVKMPEAVVKVIHECFYLIVFSQAKQDFFNANHVNQQMRQYNFDVYMVIFD